MASRRRRRRGSRPPDEPQRRGGEDAVPGIVDKHAEHSTYIERVKNGEAAKAAKPWSDAGDAVRDLIVTRLNDLGGITFQAGRMAPLVTAEIVRRVAAILEAAEAASRAVVAEAMVQIALVEATWHVAVMDPAMPIGVSLQMPPVDQIRALNESARWRKFGDAKKQRPLIDWTKGIESGAKSKVRGVVGRALREGMPIPEVKRELRKVTDLTTHQAEAVARTGISHAANVASRMFADANTDLIIGWLFSAKLDMRTTPVCRAFDGKAFRIGDGPQLPLHFGERSRALDLPRSAKDILTGRTSPPTDDELEAARVEATQGRRAAIDYRTGRGTQVPATETYGQWLRKQPAVTQDRILGKTRGKLFRTGQLEIEQFVGDDYEPLTIPELYDRWNLRPVMPD